MSAPSALRGFTAGSLVVLTGLLLPLGLLAGWTSSVVTDTDRYVETVAPLATQPVVTRAVARHLEEQSVAALRRKAPAIAETARPVARTAATRLVASPEFAPAWAQSNRVAHTQLVGILEGSDGALVDSEGRVNMEFGSLLDTMLHRIQARTGIDTSAVPRVPASIALVRTEQLERAQSGYRLLDAVGWWVLVGAALTALLALVAAPRRARCLGGLAWAALVGLAGLAAVLAVGRTALASRSPEPAVLGAIWDVLVRDPREWIHLGMVAAVLVLVLSWLLRRDGVQLGARLLSLLVAVGIVLLAW